MQNGAQGAVLFWFALQQRAVWFDGSVCRNSCATTTFGISSAYSLERPRPGVLNSMDGSVGEFYWAGYAGTYFWVDPKEELVGVYMMQSVKHLLWYATTFKTLVVQAVVE